MSGPQAIQIYLLAPLNSPPLVPTDQGLHSTRPTDFRAQREVEHGYSTFSVSLMGHIYRSYSDASRVGQTVGVSTILNFPPHRVGLARASGPPSPLKRSFNHTFADNDDELPVVEATSSC